jgi:Tfp pilus assembly protein PilF|tara:strand:+ start:326 stop:748 length:423 start_codon:yes stop_codon:yes gene_type:complete
MKKRLLKFSIFLFLLSSSLNANTSYYAEGLAFYENKQLEKAKFKFEQDIVHNPKNEKSYLYLSKIFNLQNKQELEEKNLKTVILLNPKNEEAVFNLASLRLKASDFTGSKQLVNKLLKFCKTYCQKSQSLKVEIEKSIKN